MDLLVFIEYRETSAGDTSNDRSFHMTLANLMIAAVVKGSVLCLINHDLNGMVKFIGFQNVVWHVSYSKNPFLYNTETQKLFFSLLIIVIQ